jgi:hypothetical protein
MLTDGDTLLIGSKTHRHELTVEFRWVAADFRATDHWSDGYATEQELEAVRNGVMSASAASAVCTSQRLAAPPSGPGFMAATGPACEGWWLAQLQGLWLAKATARALAMHQDIDRLERLRQWRDDNPNQTPPEIAELDAALLGAQGKMPCRHGHTGVHSCSLLLAAATPCCCYIG